MSDSLQPHELQYARLPCPSPTPRVYSNPCPSSQWRHPTISSSVIPSLLLLPSNFPSIGVFSNESALRIRWPKYWSFSFSISSSNGYSGLISFRMDWLDLLAVQKHCLKRWVKVQVDKGWTLIDFFWSGPFLKSLLNLLQYFLCFYVLGFLAAEACRILITWPGVKPTPPALEGKV